MVVYIVINLIFRCIGLLAVLINARNLPLDSYAQLALMLGSIGLATELSLMGLNSSLLKYGALFKNDNKKLKEIYSNSIFAMAFSRELVYSYSWHSRLSLSFGTRNSFAGLLETK